MAASGLRAMRRSHAIGETASGKRRPSQRRTTIVAADQPKV